MKLEVIVEREGGERRARFVVDGKEVEVTRWFGCSADIEPLVLRRVALYLRQGADFRQEGDPERIERVQMWRDRLVSLCLDDERFEDMEPYEVDLAKGVIAALLLDPDTFCAWEDDEEVN